MISGLECLGGQRLRPTDAYFNQLRGKFVAKVEGYRLRFKAPEYGDSPSQNEVIGHNKVEELDLTLRV